MVQVQLADIEQHKQLSDYVSSYYDALVETDGVVYEMASPGTAGSVGEAGLRIDGTALRLGWRYCLSFTLEKLSGEMLTIGGSMPVAYDVTVTIDAEQCEDDWEWGVPFPNDGRPHVVEVSFTVVDRLKPLMNNHLYILPNRGMARQVLGCPTILGYRARLSNMALKAIEWE